MEHSIATKSIYAPRAKMEVFLEPTNTFFYAQVSGSATQNTLNGQLILLSES